MEMSTPPRSPQGKPPVRRSSGGSASRRGNQRRVVPGSWLVRFLTHPVGKAFLIIVLVAIVVGAGAFIFYYEKYAKLIDETH